MEAAPPSYRDATLNDHWDIIARYVASNDLCSAALVCSRWHTTFVPHLWGNPASHFGRENDHVYVALTKFKRTLQSARLLVRSLTHTLHLPPAHAELYNGPHADWLRDILERLPNLQTLIVRGLPFFDHASLQALRHIQQKPRQNAPPSGVIELPGSSGYASEGASSSTVPSFGLRLLDASRCSNVTASGLALALTRFETLMYLDLSFTHPARDTSVLAALRQLSGLQVLKLRGINLVDTSLEALAPAIGWRVRSLDVRDNHITDRGVRILLDHCFTSGECAPAGGRSPALLPYLGGEMLNIYQGEDFEGYLRNAFTGSFVSRLAIEDVPEGGITHLYIAGNELTVEGASGLLRSRRLHVLDLATLSGGLLRHPSVSDRKGSASGMRMPGVEKLVPVVTKCAADALTFLRINHALVTKDAPAPHQEELVQGRVELADTALPLLPADAAELGGSSVQPEAFELPTAQSPRYELPGDPMQLIVSPAFNDQQHVDPGESTTSDVRRGSTFAPEAVNGLVTNLDDVTLLSPVSALDESTLSSLISPSSPTSVPMSFGSLQPASPGERRPRSYSSVATERKARLCAHTNGNSSHNLHPAMVPHLDTLMLTDVPLLASNREVSDRLISFIKQCAEEAWLAKAHAKLDYALPPGRKGHASALKSSANKIFALKRLVLEMAPEESARRNSKASPWHHMITKSMTEDHDSEALWSAAETDFSFFGDGEECDFPSLEPGRFAHSISSSEKEVSFGDSSSPQSSTLHTPPAMEAKVDTVKVLSAFRKERRLAHERNIEAGAVDPETEGFWDGIVQVIWPGSLRNDEETDYYGNT